MSDSIATLPTFITIFDMQALCAEVFPSMHTCAVDTDTQVKLYALRLLQSLILEPENPSVAHRALEVVSTYLGPTAITHGAWCDLRMHCPVWSLSGSVCRSPFMSSPNWLRKRTQRCVCVCMRACMHACACGSVAWSNCAVVSRAASVYSYFLLYISSSVSLSDCLHCRWGRSRLK